MICTTVPVLCHGILLAVTAFSRLLVVEGNLSDGGVPHTALARHPVLAATRIRTRKIKRQTQKKGVGGLSVMIKVKS